MIKQGSPEAGTTQVADRQISPHSLSISSNTSEVRDLTAVPEEYTVPIWSQPGIHLEEVCQVSKRDMLSLKRALRALRLAPDSRILISQPSGRQLRVENAPASLLIAYEVLRSTPAGRVVISSRIGEEELESENLSAEKADQFSDFQHYYGMELRRDTPRLEISPKVQGRGNPSFEAKLAVRDAIQRGFTHLILPAHNAVMAARLAFAVEAEKARYCPSQVPLGLWVIIMNHNALLPTSLTVFERASLLTDMYGQRCAPGLMDQLAVHQRVPDAISAWLESVRKGRNSLRE